MWKRVQIMLGVEQVTSAMPLSSYTYTPPY